MSNTYTRKQLKYYFSTIEELAQELEYDMAIPKNTSNGFNRKIITEYALENCQYYRYILSHFK